MKLINPQPMDTLPENSCEVVYVQFHGGEIRRTITKVIRTLGATNFKSWSHEVDTATTEEDEDEAV